MGTGDGGKRRKWWPFKRDKTANKEPKKLGWIQGVLVKLL